MKRKTAHTEAVAPPPTLLERLIGARIRGIGTLDACEKVWGTLPERRAAMAAAAIRARGADQSRVAAGAGLPSRPVLRERSPGRSPEREDNKLQIV